jgi:hypothetical protein
MARHQIDPHAGFLKRTHDTGVIRAMRAGAAKHERGTARGGILH